MRGQPYGEAGRLAVELQRLSAALDEAVARKRRRDTSRLRRQLTVVRTQTWTAERRLEELAKSAPRDWTVPRG
jgi:hypothetical protein